MQSHRAEGESEAIFFMKNLLAASTAAYLAVEAATPIDTAKVRLSVQRIA